MTQRETVIPAADMCLSCSNSIMHIQQTAVLVVYVLSFMKKRNKSSSKQTLSLSLSYPCAIGQHATKAITAAMVSRLRLRLSPMNL